MRPRYAEFLSDITGVETEIFDSQIPGGMISNMESQLKQQGAGDRMKEVLEEVPRVRKDAGYPPLVTPSSQIVGTQAVFNVLLGRYKVLPAEFADLMLGYYGETIGPRDPELVAQAEKQAKKPADHYRPADLLKPEWNELRDGGDRRCQGCDGTDEDVLTYAMFPAGGAQVLRHPRAGPEEPGQGPGREAAPPRRPRRALPANGKRPARTGHVRGKTQRELA